MDISADIELINSMLQKVQNPSIRSSIKDLLAKLKKNGITSEERISIEQYNKEIEESEKEYEEGKYVTTEKFIDEAKGW